MFLHLVVWFLFSFILQNVSGSILFMFSKLFWLSIYSPIVWPLSSSASFSNHHSLTLFQDENNICTKFNYQDVAWYVKIFDKEEINRPKFFPSVVLKYLNGKFLKCKNNTYLVHRYCYINLHFFKTPFKVPHSPCSVGPFNICSCMVRVKTEIPYTYT